MTIGAIDPEQRRIAERLVLAALRKFHREQPLSVDLRVDSLVSRVRAAAGRKPPPRHRGSAPLTLEDPELRRVIDEMADDGRLARHGRRVGLPDVAPSLDPEMAERVERLMEGLRSAGAAPPRVDGLAARLGIPPTVLDQLRVGGQLRQVAPGIDYPADVWSALRARIEGMKGPMSVARLRDELRTSRRHAEAILAATGRTKQRPPSETQSVSALEDALRLNRGRLMRPEYLRSASSWLGRPEETIVMLSLAKTDELRLAMHERPHTVLRFTARDARWDAERFVARLGRGNDDGPMVLLPRGSEFCGGLATSLSEIASRAFHIVELDGEDLRAYSPDATRGLWIIWEMEVAPDGSSLPVIEVHLIVNWTQPLTDAGRLASA